MLRLEAMSVRSRWLEPGSASSEIFNWFIIAIIENALFPRFEEPWLENIPNDQLLFDKGPVAMLSFEFNRLLSFKKPMLAGWLFCPVNKIESGELVIDKAWLLLFDDEDDVDNEDESSGGVDEDDDVMRLSSALLKKNWIRCSLVNLTRWCAK